MATYGTLAKLADTNRRVLNLYDEYIQAKHDPAAEAAMITHIMTKNPERVRTRSWSASSAGRCLREQQFTYLGMPSLRGQDVDGENIFLNGDYLHLRYQVAGMLAGWLIDVEVPVAHLGQVKGTMDGLLVWDEVLELKSINDRGYKQVADYGPKEGHKKQATAYMMASGKTATRFIYENKNTNRNCEFLFELDQEYVNQVQSEWNRLNELTARKELAPMQHECINERGDFRWCDYRKMCEGAVWPRPRVVLV